MAGGRYNGAYYYSQEIVANIIPNVRTDRNWITINTPGLAMDHSIVFVHNNLRPELYEWLSAFDDLVLVCGIKETCEKVEHLGRAIYLPLSIDTKYVRKFKARKKTHKEAFAGRLSKRSNVACLPEQIDYLGDIPRPQLLKAMSKYESIYAVGRTAIEAKCLGCKVKAYDPRFPNPDMWNVLDNLEAARMLQKELDENR